jgi:hypothetical protein
MPDSPGGTKRNFVSSSEQPMNAMGIIHPKYLKNLLIFSFDKT